MCNFYPTLLLPSSWSWLGLTSDLQIKEAFELQIVVGWWKEKTFFISTYYVVIPTPTVYSNSELVRVFLPMKNKKGLIPEKNLKWFAVRLRQKKGSEYPQKSEFHIIFHLSLLSLTKQKYQYIS